MNHRILVIDDNAAIHEDIRKILALPKSGSATFEDQDALLFGKPTARIRMAGKAFGTKEGRARSG